MIYAQEKVKGKWSVGNKRMDRGMEAIALPPLLGQSVKTWDNIITISSVLTNTELLGRGTLLHYL